MTTLIIARYNEDIEWLVKYKKYKIIIYNKGTPLLNNHDFSIKKLPNLGRESHTWLTHIVNNYDKLDEYNIFLQGRINDLNCMAFKNPDDYLIGLKLHGFSVSRLGLLGPFHWSKNVGIEKNQKYKMQWDKGEILSSNLGFRKFAKRIFPRIPLFVATSYGGCFGVSKELIRNYEISFYKNLLEYVSKDSNPIEGHFLERLWCYMFTKNLFLYQSCKDVIKTKLERSFFQNFLKNSKFLKKN